MKTAGIVRIVVGLAVAAALTFVLVWVLKGNTMFVTGRNGFSIQSDGAVQTHGEAAVAEGQGKAGSGTAKASVRALDIEWVAGSVTVQTGDTDAILYEESCGKPLSDSQKMLVTEQDGKLKIRYTAKTLGVLDAVNLPAKALVVTVPRNMTLEELDVESTSADVFVTGAVARDVELDATSGRIEATDVTGVDALDVSTVSGAISLTACSAGKLDIETTSGTIDSRCDAGKIDASSVSGAIRLTVTAIPAELAAEAVSGRIELKLPETEGGFTARIDTVSGGVRCGIPAVQDGARLIAGDGDAAFRFSTVSGDIRLEKAE